MKAIIVNNLEEFETLQTKIHNSLKIIPGYSEDKGFLRWAQPTVVNSETGKIACPVDEETTLRGVVMRTVLSEYDIIEMDRDDETWFPAPEEII